MANPNYTRYSVLELLECLDSIDKEKWPDRYQAILHAIDNKKNNSKVDKAVHDTALFNDYCTKLEHELHDSFEVDVLSFIQPLTGGVYPEVLQHSSCPICAKKLTIKNATMGWRVSCKSCELENKVWQTGSG